MLDTPYIQRPEHATLAARAVSEVGIQSILYRTTSATTMATTGDSNINYETARLTAVPLLAQQSNEADIYAAFEEAISDRVLIMRDIHLHQSVKAKHSRRNQLRTVRLMALALLCMLVGFDLMGLLVLLTR